MIKKFLTMKEKESQYAVVSLNNNFKENSVDDKFWIYCKGCNKHMFKKDIEDNLNICPKCSMHYKLKARDRVDLIIDKGSFNEFEFQFKTQDPIKFPGYKEKINSYKEKTKESEAVICGWGYINNIKVVICVMNPEFMMGSMGSVVGELITRSIEYAYDNNLPLIICSASGGARMQEGMVSLMQMAKTSQAISRLDEKGLLYISILTDPTTGGVSASFAMLGDVIISEPNTMIGFAGSRVIEQTINQTLPQGFQSSEFLLENGFIDMIVNRGNLKNTLHRLLLFHNINNT